MDSATRRGLIARAEFGRKSAVSGSGGIAISSHPIATRTAVDVLRDGGNACDALLAASVMQTVVEPHMTTLTGAFSMLYVDAATGETTCLNAGCDTPLAPLPGLSPADLPTGRCVAVPGFWGGIEAAAKRHGRTPISRLLAPSIELARDGFEIFPFLYGMMFEQIAQLGRSDYGRAVFFDDGALRSPGSLLRQPALAETLEALVADGSEHFYHGAFARRFVDTVQRAGGVITLDDMARYETRWVEPAWGSYRGHRIAGSPPPESGGTHVIEALNLVELLDLAELGAPTESAEVLYQMIRFTTEVYLAGARQHDPRTHPLPLELIVSKEYARMRYELLQMDAPRPPGGAGVYPGSNHLTVVDGDGNVATALHSVLSYPWTNGMFVDGVQVAAAGGHWFRVMPRPGERSTNYGAPVVVFDGDSTQPWIACGSPGVGLIAAIVQNIVNIVDFGLDVETSVHRPRFGGLTISHDEAMRPTLIEVDVDERLRRDVERRGVRLEVTNPWNFHQGSFEGVVVDPRTGERSACGDPRRTSAVECA